MDKVLALINHPFVFELIKSLIAFNFGVLIGIFYKDWKEERRARRNDAERADLTAGTQEDNE